MREIKWLGTHWCWRESRGFLLDIGWHDSPAHYFFLALGPLNIWKYRAVANMTPYQKWLMEQHMNEACKRPQFEVPPTS